MSLSKMGELPIYKVHIQGNEAAKAKVLHRNFPFPMGYANHLENSLIEGTDYDPMDDSFYSTDEELEYEGPVTHSRAKVLAKANTLMNEHFNAHHDDAYGLWLLGLL